MRSSAGFQVFGRQCNARYVAVVDTNLKDSRHRGLDEHVQYVVSTRFASRVLRHNLVGFPWHPFLPVASRLKFWVSPACEYPASTPDNKLPGSSQGAPTTTSTPNIAITNSNKATWSSWLVRGGPSSRPTIRGDVLGLEWHPKEHAGLSGPDKGR